MPKVDGWALLRVSGSLGERNTRYIGPARTTRMSRNGRFGSTRGVYNSLSTNAGRRVIRVSMNATFFVRRVNGLEARLASQIKDHERFI